MSFKKYYVSPYRMNDVECRHGSDEVVYVSAEVDLVYGVAKDRFSDLDKKYQSTRAKLEIAVEALNVVKDCSDNLSHAMKKSGLKDCIDAYCIAIEAIAKIKELS